MGAGHATGEGKTWWVAPGLVRRGEGRNFGPEPLLWFLREGRGKAR